MNKPASIFGDLTAEEIKAKLQARREAEEDEKQNKSEADTEAK